MNIVFGDYRLPYQRYRNTDPVTSKEAAKNARSGKAEKERQQIYQVVAASQGLTAREVSQALNLDYITVQRRISEVQGLSRNGQKRDGCMVWIKE